MTGLVRISEAASLALHALGVMARSPQRWTTERLAEVLRASTHHLAKVMQRLVKAGLLRSVRGPHGGFELTRPPEEITLAEIYQAIEGPLPTAGCLLGEPICRNGAANCMLGDLVNMVHREVHDYLSHTTLQRMAQALDLVTISAPGDGGSQSLDPPCQFTPLS
ncbi:Rrf2 family transcriptional regulator [Thermogutta sp.]|jgi:Rrf2 family protein|uniref:RrF2 family transcriptional regulator n=1 Tax=Thermogutta sp. TaxID=1962930 RepID=UPI00321F6A3A